jgi:hypothetical protein
MKKLRFYLSYVIYKIVDFLLRINYNLLPKK